MNAPVLNLPPLRLTLDGSALSDPLAQRLISLSVRQVLGAPSVLELVFADPPATALRGLMPGQTAEVALATGGTLFSGLVTEIGADATPGGMTSFRILARDPLHALARRQSLIALRDASVADLAQRLAGDIGLSARCDEPTPRRALILQGEQTDLDLLADLAAEAGLYPIVRDATLLLLSLAGDGEEAIALVMGASLLSAHVRLSGADVLPGGRMIGRDSVTLKGRETKASLARQDRVELRDPGGDLGVGERVWLNRVTDGDGEAEARLQGGIDRAAATVAVAEGLAEGDARLCPGRVIQLGGMADAFTGSYALTRCLHRFTADEGYVTEFSTERPARPLPARSPRVTVGEVTGVRDPEGLGRCAVMLTDFAGTEAAWMHVLTAGAGARKGIVGLPDVGDKVLVLLPEGDPGRGGLVLGGLYGTERLPKGAEDIPRGIFLRSQDGQVLELRGKGGGARLANRTGSLLDITPGRTRLAAASDMVIEAPGKVITIRAAEIRFERG